VQAAAASLLLVALPQPGSAQQGAAVLALDSLLARVAANHPVARQARLLVDQADGVVRSALGAMFDPTLSASWERKGFGGTEYFNYYEAALKVPTPLGVDVKLGLEKVRGQYIAPDRRTPGQGLVTLGLSMPLGQGIITDRRRTELAAARAKRESAAGARSELLNALLAEATTAWAEWDRAERMLAVAREGQALVAFRATGIRRRVEAGELAAIDTVEVRLEVVRREATLALAEAEAVAARERVGTYVWDDRGLPVPLDSTVRPAESPMEPLPSEEWLARELMRALEEHPKVRKARGDADAAAALQRQAAVELFPDLEGEVARLGDRADVGGLSDFPATAGNYKFGVSASTGLLLLKERGKAGEAAAKGRIARLVLADVQRDVGAAVRTAAAAMDGAGRATVWQREAVTLSRRLLDAELARFEAGESSLFLVNQRERALLDETNKLAEAEAKRVVARAKLATALGYPARLPEP
jgi:outer membrane protein TolC